jgi:hypothetical protein
MGLEKCYVNDVFLEAFIYLLGFWEIERWGGVEDGLMAPYGRAGDQCLKMA